MGIPIVPFYGNADVGSAIEDIERVIAHIKSNKYSKKDIKLLIDGTLELVKALATDENKN